LVEECQCVELPPKQKQKMEGKSWGEATGSCSATDVRLLKTPGMSKTGGDRKGCIKLRQIFSRGKGKFVKGKG